MVHRIFTSIDDAGDAVLLLGRRVTIGHRSNPAADISLLGDLDPLHATLELVHSFHGGEGWTLTTSEGSRAPLVDGSALEPGAGPRSLFDGDAVHIGTSASFSVRRPDDSSSALVLELSRGTDCFGAQRVILFAPGRASRVRIGARRRRHVPVAGLEHDIELVGGDGHLDIRCPGGVRPAATPADGETLLRVPLPVEARLHVAIGAAPDRMPPFGIALAPLGG